ncbi:hypothetical protein Gotur_006592 [Gossypium turneri]
MTSSVEKTIAALINLLLFTQKIKPLGKMLKQSLILLKK